MNDTEAQLREHLQQLLVGIDGLSRREWRQADRAARVATLQQVAETVAAVYGIGPLVVAVQAMKMTHSSAYQPDSRTVELTSTLVGEHLFRRSAISAVLRRARGAMQVDAALAKASDQVLTPGEFHLAKLTVYKPESDAVVVDELDAGSFSRRVLRGDRRFLGTVAVPPVAVPFGIGAVVTGAAVLLASGSLSGTHAKSVHHAQPPQPPVQRLNNGAVIASSGVSQRTGHTDIYATADAVVPYGKPSLIRFLQANTAGGPMTVTSNGAELVYGSGGSEFSKLKFEVAATTNHQNQTVLRYRGLMTVASSTSPGRVQSLETALQGQVSQAITAELGDLKSSLNQAQYSGL